MRCDRATGLLMGSEWFFMAFQVKPEQHIKLALLGRMQDPRQTRPSINFRLSLYLFVCAFVSLLPCLIIKILSKDSSSQLFPCMPVSTQTSLCGLVLGWFSPVLITVFYLWLVVNFSSSSCTRSPRRRFVNIVLGAG